MLTVKEIWFYGWRLCCCNEITEAKLSAISSYLVNDINHETVAYKENYDGTTLEPELLPAEFPNLLINGSEGIALNVNKNTTTLPQNAKCML